VRLASESEFASAFSDCELGAMPPFGHLDGLETFVDEQLTRDREIAFNAGTHTEAIRMSFDDYRRIAEPRILELAESAAATRRGRAGPRPRARRRTARRTPGVVPRRALPRVRPGARRRADRATDRRAAARAARRAGGIEGPGPGTARAGGGGGRRGRRRVL